MKTSRRTFLKGVAGGAVAAAISLDSAAAKAAGVATEAACDWPEDIERVWVGPDCWANRLQDWRISRGRLECVKADAALPMRTVHLVTRRLSGKRGNFAISARTGVIGKDARVSAQAATGFLFGVGGDELDYRAAALAHHNPGPGGGLFAGINGRGELFVRDFESAESNALTKSEALGTLPGDLTLLLEGKPGEDGYELSLTAQDGKSGKELARTTLKSVEPARLIGGIALVSHPGEGANAARFWFRDWHAGGSKIATHKDRNCGPVLCTQYTVHHGVLKLTAQMMPVGAADTQTAALQIKRGLGWKTVATARIITPGFTAPFRVENWDAGKDATYRVVYQLKRGRGRTTPHYWSGTIRRDPVDKETLVVASLSCVQQVDGGVDRGKMFRWRDRVWFPHADMVPNVVKQKPDLLFFAGDQIYEGNPTRPVREPEDEAKLDYLYKWYMWGWSYASLVKDYPCVTIPDDHDVYQGNVWGDQGRPSGDLHGQKGGYAMTPEWLNMMQRTQCSHLPDPYDPTPVEQGIGVYYTALVYGGVGFAILEDRKFKSSPSIVKVRMTPDSHILDKNFDTREADVPGARLLGERQLKFLRDFARDWRGQEMKAALSQTIFCNLQISSRGETTGELDKDLDSNGWPQSGRNDALREMRKGFMVHLAGDQHLASAIHHGVDEFEDSVWSLCSPAVSNVYVRYWNPDYPPLNHKPGMEPFMGRYEDGFHNKLTIHAVANPVNDPKPGEFPEPVELHRKATGYAMARFNKHERTITLEVWPRYADPANSKTGAQYPGWPITIRQTDNYGRIAAAWLPVLKVSGATDPVVQVIDEADGEVVYTLRIKGTEFRPKVFRVGTYSIRIGGPGTSREKTLTRVAALQPDEHRVIDVRL